jgi:hypothetical protein
VILPVDAGATAGLARMPSLRNDFKRAPD